MPQAINGWLVVWQAMMMIASRDHSLTLSHRAVIELVQEERHIDASCKLLMIHLQKLACIASIMELNVSLMTYR